MPDDNQVTLFAQTNARNDRRVFGIRRRDRRSHMWIVGKTGTGKSTLLENLIRQDIGHGEGVAVLDPHGDLVERVFRDVPARRRKDVVYFNVPDREHPIGWNPLDGVPAEKRSLVAAGLLEVFKKLWTDSWGNRLEHILRNALFTLLEQPEATLADILRLLDDDAYRRVAVAKVTNQQVRRFWQQEYDNYPVRYRADAAAPIQTKVGAFLADPILNRILTQPKSDFNLREVMDEGKILLVNLAKGKLGEDSAVLLGSLLVSQIGSVGLSRADVPETKRRDFYVYLDEFHTFTTLSLATMLSELRKYRINLTLANQYLAQIDRQILDAVLGNVGTVISFRLGPADAAFISKEFSPKLDALDFMNLPNYSIYLRLMIDGTVSPPFSAVTLPEIRAP
jgi:type IV secretory pathway TraG/TraD family ATPase VirD4